MKKYVKLSDVKIEKNIHGTYSMTIGKHDIHHG